MSRTVKIVQLEDGSDLEIYVDNCNICFKEMGFPKKEADDLDRLFPFIKEKLEKGSPCIDCYKKSLETGEYTLYSEEDIKKIIEYASSKDSR